MTATLWSVCNNKGEILIVLILMNLDRQCERPLRKLNIAMIRLFITISEGSAWQMQTFSSLNKVELQAVKLSS